MLRLIPVLVFIGLLTPCMAQPPSPLVYSNTVDGHENRFVLSGQNEVSGASYVFEAGSPKQFDRLTFVKDVEFNDGRDNSPAVVRGWMYKGTDKSDVVWRIIFGKDENTIPGTYPIYYSSETGDQFRRWKVAGGTRRRNATLEDEVFAILWANQVDVDRLGLQPFSHSEQLPLTVTFAWNAISAELNSRLERENVSLGWTLVTLPNGQFQVDLENYSNGETRELFRMLRVANDLDVRKTNTHLAQQLLAADLSREFFDDNKLNFSRIAEATRSFVRTGSPELRQFQLSTRETVLAGKCHSFTTPWQPMVQGAKYHQFWRMKFSLEAVTIDGAQQYSVVLLLSIGECPTPKVQFGEKFIVAKYESVDADAFSNLSIRAKQPDAAPMHYTKIVSSSQVIAIPQGVSLGDQMKGFNLKQLFDRTFDNYVRRLKGQ
jgi:hypothetical protein